jgi:hypothetical protein
MADFHISYFRIIADVQGLTGADKPPIPARSSLVAGIDCQKGALRP